jgi:hypothetical protein
MAIFHDFLLQAVNSGVSQETIVMLILLPLVAAMVAAARHVIGFRGFGIFIPTAIAAGLVVTGIGTGALIFAVVLLTATFSRYILRKLHVHYLPRMALLLWCVSLITLALITVSPQLGTSRLTTISIFPILILVLLAEEFISVQIGKSLREAAQLTLETIIVALFGFLIFQSQFFRTMAFEQPLWVAISPVVINLLVGRFTGLRLLEYRRFRRLLK